jgi:hypothetical protein
MATWIQRKEEEQYFSQLDQMLVQRLRDREAAKARRKLGKASDHMDLKSLNELSLEINEELDRLESLINDEQS